MLDENGHPVSTPHNMYVDDNLIAEVRGRMKQAMSASIEALFILLGYPEPERRKNAVCMEKYLAAMCSYEKAQLGIRINTRDMVVGMPAVKLDKLKTELQHWHKKRKSFTIFQVATLTGNLQHICSVTPWGKYLYMSIQHSVAVALSGNSIELKKPSRKYMKLVNEITKEKVFTEDELKAHFAQSHATKMV